MSTLVDPHICPDCRAPLDSAATCTGCGLRLVGPDAALLWQRMQEADRLVEQLRAAVPSTASRPVMAAVRGAAPAGGPATPLPVGDQPAGPASAPRPRAGLPGASVPVVLLGLGGLCLLVAAIVFVAVAWGSLGLAAKTTIMLGVTVLFGVAAVVVTRRGLRFATETLWAVVSGLVALDLGAAYGADLLGLGRLDDRDAVGLVGATLLGLAIAVGAWVTSTALRRWHGAAAVATVGTVMLAGAEAWTSEHNPVAVALSVPLLAGLSVGVDRVSDRHLRPIAAVTGCAALVSWLVLLGYGADRMSTTTSSGWWTDLSGWPLLAAAALAAIPTALRGAPDRSRSVAAGGSLVALALFGAGPAATTPTADLLEWALVSALLAAVSSTAPRTWARPAAFLNAFALLVWSSWVLVRPLVAISDVPTTAPLHDNQLALHLPGAVGGPAPWTAIVSVLVVGAAAAGLLRHLPSPAAREATGRALIALGPGVLALGATTALLETGPTLLAATVAWSTIVLVTAAMAVTVRRHDAALVAVLLFFLYAVVVGLRLASASHLLAACLATAVAAGLVIAYARAESGLLRSLLGPVLCCATVVLAGFAATHWPYVLGGGDDAAGLSLVAVAAVAMLVARPAARDLPGRIALEATGLLAGLVATALPTSTSVVAMVLTVLGSAVALVAILNRDRDRAAWLAVALLGLATVLRVVEDVRAPELYTLPAAALLLGAGWWRLSSDDETSSARALSSGLTLALAPSLLLALDDPISLRGALVAVAGLAVLALGVMRLWAAPFVAGAVTTGVLAVRHLGPVVDGLPRWISLGFVGVLLLVVGVTWEQRRRDVSAAGRYLASMR